ncbi:MAG: hypothetical protein VX278_19125, partial [Myxococcota bacterium]|nr:hypothetical protein [Myxococcota bacterium]
HRSESMIFTALILLGCAPEKTTDSAEQPKPVLATLTLLDAIQSTPKGNVTLTSSLESTNTDGNGQGTVLVEEETQVVIAASAPGYLTHNMYLYSGRINYNAVSFLASETAATQMYSLLSPTLIPDESKGVLIVALDTPELLPSVGAAAAISSESDDPFILTNSVVYGNAITSASRGFVAFPNVATGSTIISVTPPNGQTCMQYPAGDDNIAEVDMIAGEVSVVFFQCE